MRLHYLLSALFFMPSYSLFILLPLYIYPQSGSWAPVFNAVSAQPNVTFQIIVNPDSGPGADQYPDAGYIAAIAKLNKYKNVKLLGYVHTSYAKRAYTDITKDIDTYAGWSSYTSANISVSGIFFDEVTDSTDQAQKTYMHNVSTYAYTQLPSSKTAVVFNPGEVIDPAYFSYCNTVVEYEDTFKAYKNRATINKFQNGYNAQSAIIINTMSVSAAKVKSLVHVMKTASIGGVYFSSDCCYQKINGTLLNDLAAAVATA